MFGQPPADISQLRVTRAQLAKFLGCSKQTTGTWAKKGIVTFAAHDDRARLGEALRQVMERTDPHKLRVRAFRDLVKDQDGLRNRIVELECQLEAARQENKAASFRFQDNQAQKLFELAKQLVDSWHHLEAARTKGDLAEVFDQIIDHVFYRDIATDGHQVPRTNPNTDTKEDSHGEA